MKIIAAAGLAALSASATTAAGAQTTPRPVLGAPTQPDPYATESVVNHPAP